MNNNLTDITVVLDRSGSMHGIKHDVEGGFQAFIEKQQKEPGEANISLVQFDTHYDIVYTAKNIKDTPALNLVPRGGTALLDALGRAINETGDRLRDMPESERPGKVVFVVITDGYENSSHEFSLEFVKKMIQHQEQKYSWLFMFLGGDLDAVREAGNLGLSAGKAMSFSKSSVGVQNTFDTLSAKMSNYRGMSQHEYQKTVLTGEVFTEEDRKKSQES